MSPVETRKHPTAEAQNPPAISVRIDSAKHYSKNTLVAFVDFTLIEAGLSIKGASIHEKEGARWVSLPSRSYSDAQGTHWAPVVEFASKEARSRINDAVLAAFEEYAAAEGSRQ
ncbi:MAG: septation protein SpoVG family protein [Acidobacteriota bacterium]|nr:septation protein SpoVG family protein [Acidobacteriota bacterium]